MLDKTEALGHSISADGSQIVGEAAAQTAYRRAFIWTPSIGVQDLGTPLFPNDPDHSRSGAYGMSATGSVIGGRALPTQNPLIPQAFQFTTAPSFSASPSKSVMRTTTRSRSAHSSTRSAFARWCSTPTRTGISSYKAMSRALAAIGRDSRTSTCKMAFGTASAFCR